MARNDSLDAAEKVRLIRALAFQIRRKHPAVEAFTEVLEQEFRGGRHRMFRPTSDALGESGFLAALKVLGLIGEEAAVILDIVIDANDHRLLAGALERLADHTEQSA